MYWLKNKKTWIIPDSINVMDVWMLEALENNDNWKSMAGPSLTGTSWL